MKKFIVILLALTLALSIVACGGGNDTTEPNETGSNPSTTPDASTPEETTPEETTPAVPADAEPLPAEALNHWTFDSADADGLITLHQIHRPVESELTGVGTEAFDIVESKHEIMYADGPVGQAAYLDGKYGIKLDMKEPADDSYTIAFWYNGDRFITLGPILQLGRNVGMDGATLATDPSKAVTWFNICQCAWGPTESPNLTPTVWNRNSSIPWANAENGVWPWIAPDTVYGKQEWTHVAIVVDGNRYTCPDDNGDRIGTRLYVNGVLKFDASAENQFYQGVAPEIFKDSASAIRGLEAYVGINYWDACYKGFIDDMYVYDEALTAGQVTSLFELGDPSVKSEAPAYTGPTDDDAGAPEPTEPVLPEITPNADAIAVLGTPERTLGFWSEHTASYEIPADGTTVTFKLNNYSDAGANFRNFYNVFCSIPMEASNVDPNTMEGYVEYGVIRADSWDFSTGNPDGSGTYERSWGDDWATWLAQMTDVEVTVAVSRTGSTVTLEYTYTCADGSTMTAKAVVELPKMTDDMPCYGFIGGEGAYIELLSVE